MLPTRILATLGLAILAGALLFGGRAERTEAGIEFLMGDTNCDDLVNSIDSAIVLQNTAGLLQTIPCGRNAHVNPDARITSVDAAIILQYVARLIGELTPVPSYQGPVVSLGSDACRGLDVGPQTYVLDDPTSGTPGQSIRVWGFLDASATLCGSSPVLRVVAVVAL